ncbi:MAG: hypothetical protein KMY53_02660 [Desulfarculus sp.]|nr:hypothetical protein [Pseudomonadota bacterium]MBV1717233.1 hypothetical protein [Desulfarculus sp.]MBU4576536.1 hypothetical protein [Pseudomonadota bacterium]MBU4598459.1 hypothetical protein [Pseudomonadota bacterium]MBV1737041.1 hypothetical protein [Desulfarculus sp.]
MLGELFYETAPFVGDVVCYEVEWQEHVVAEHPEMEGRKEEVRATVLDPSLVVTSYNESYLLVNEDISHPDIPEAVLRVPVRRHGTIYRVATAYFDDDVTGGGVIVYRRDATRIVR